MARLYIHIDGSPVPATHSTAHRMLDLAWLDSGCYRTAVVQTVALVRNPEVERRLAAYATHAGWPEYLVPEADVSELRW